MVRVVAAVFAVMLAGLLGGCSSTPTVSVSELETQISSQLTKTVGQAPKSVSCPGDLEGTVGKTERCNLVTPSGDTYGLTVTVTSVSGSTVDFHIQVDTKPSATPTPAG